MFGSLRFILAALVCIGHFQPIGGVRVHAVYGFFVLSGYLMTVVCNGKYRQKTGLFILNRILRLYPCYWVVLAITVPLVGGDLAYLPRTALLLFEPSHRYEPMSHMWAIAVELFWYMAIALGVSRTPKRTMQWVGGSLFLASLLFCSGASWEIRYYSIFAASLPFSLGALIYWWQDVRPQFVEWRLLSGLLFVPWLAEAAQPGLQLGLSFYISIFLFCLLVAALSRSRDRPLERFLGGLSYPLYICHYPVRLWLVGLGIHDIWLQMAIGFPLILFLSIALYLAIEIPVNSFRRCLTNGYTRYDHHAVRGPG